MGIGRKVLVEAAHTEADQLECGEVQAGHQLAPMLVAKGKAAATELHQHQCLHQTTSTTSSFYKYCLHQSTALPATPAEPFTIYHW